MSYTLEERAEILKNASERVKEQLGLVKEQPGTVEEEKPRYIYWTDEDGFTWRIRK